MSVRGSDRSLILWMIASLLLQLIVLVFKDGLSATPYVSGEGGGLSFGFNEPIRSEHLLAIWQNARWASVISAAYWYSWVLIGMHSFGILSLSLNRGNSTAWTKWVFGLQFLIFPAGLLAILFLPIATISILREGVLDRESFEDLPFTLLASQGAWLCLSGFALYRLKGRRGASLTWFERKQCGLPDILL